jgi:hypothetical protein
MTIFGAMFIIWIFRLFIELIKGIFVMIYDFIDIVFEILNRKRG